MARMDRVSWRYFLVFVGAALVAGCSQPQSPPMETSSAPGKTTEPVPPTPPALPPTATADIGLLIVNSTELEGALKALKGKIVVVDIWATWCAPCKREFPHLVELHTKFANDGVACVSVSVDEDSDHATALAFLRAQQAKFANYLLNEDANVWSERWKVKSIPAVIVFDRDGTQVRKFTNDDEASPFTYADVNKLVEELVAKK